MAVEGSERLKSLAEREIRNDVMHFDPDGIDPNDTNKLEEIAQFFRDLRRVGAI